MGSFYYSKRTDTFAMMLLRQFMPEGAKLHPLSAPLILMGKADDVDIHLSDSNMPKVAIKLEKRKEGFYWENVERHKKIKLNGIFLKKSRLAAGDRLEAGSEIFIVDYDAGGLEEEVGPAPKADVKGSTQLFQKGLKLFAQAAGAEKDLTQVLKKILQSLQY